MVPINFHQLYYFWVIAKAGSISAAREQLLLTQSTLSMQMKQLESSLKKTLLLRGRRGVSLTADGRLAFKYCGSIFPRAEELLSLLKSDKPSAPTVLRLGIGSSVSREKILRVLDFLRKGSPRVNVRVLSGNTEDLRERFRRGQLDFAVSDVDFSGPLGADLTARLVARVPLYFVATPAVRRKAGAFPSGLKDVPLLLQSADNPVRKETESFLRRRRIPFTIGAEVENADFLKLLLLKGKGVGVMDPITIEEDLRSGRLEKIHRGPLDMRKDVWFICRRYDGNDLRLKHAMDSLMEEFQLKT